MNLPNAVHERLDVRLQLLQLVEYDLTLLDELLRHALRQTQALTNVGGVVNHVGAIDCLEHEVQENIFVVDL